MSDTFTQGHAVIVGVGADLPNTVDDAVGLANILTDSARCAFPPSQVHLLTGSKATRTDILSTLDALAQSTTAQSTVIIYFSGHGYRVTSPTGEFYYLMPYGYDLNRLYQTAISGAEFTSRLQAIPAQKILVLLDCCYAGGFDETKVPGLQLTKAAMPPEAQSLFAKGSGRVLIASSQDDEESFTGKPYSAFTLALIESLCGVGVAKKDGYVRVSDLALYTGRMVPQRTQDRQHPILNFEQADNFVLAYYAGGDTQPKDLPFKEEPKIEPEPGALRVIDQRGQTVQGPQTNIGRDAQDVFSGTFPGSVRTGGSDTVSMQGGNYQPSWKVDGDQVETKKHFSGGIRQHVSGSQVSSCQIAADGNNNRQIIGTYAAAPATEKQLNQTDAIAHLAKIGEMIQITELPADTKEEAMTYLGAAKKAMEKEEPNKERVKTNLEGMAETLENASRKLDAGKSLWSNAKPILVKVVGWLGAVAADSFLGRL